MQLKKIEQRWLAYFHAWLDKRSPSANEWELNSKTLFVFPTLVGFAYLFLMLMIWLLGTNYQNNVILAFSYTLISLFIVVIFNTYSNLSGLTIKIVSVGRSYVGESVEVVLELRCGRKLGAQRVNIGWPGQHRVTVDVSDGEVTTCQVYIKAKERGFLSLGRFHIESHFPMGIVRCWSWMRTDLTALVYPAPMATSQEPRMEGKETSGQGGEKAYTGEDFWGLRQYQPGDPLRHIAWKHYAKEKGLYSKEYADTVSQDVWLDWDHFYRGDVEVALSELCGWVLKLESQNTDYGLKLPGLDIPYGHGVEHKERALFALATFEKPGTNMP